MADNSSLPVASGNETFANDDVGGVKYPRAKLAVGADGVAVDAAMTQVTATFNRPANTTAYAANDAVNDNATAGGGSSTLMSFTVAGERGSIRRIRIRKSDQTVATPTLRLWIYQATLTQSAGDNEAFTHPMADCVGFVDVAMTNAGTDDATGFTNCDIPFVSAAFKAQLQTLSAFTPASGETFTVDAWYLPG